MERRAEIGVLDRVGMGEAPAAAPCDAVTADPGFLIGNLVDFDQLYGYSNDVPADHGNDPTTALSDHAREIVPVLAFGPAVRAGSTMGRGATFADPGAAVTAGERTFVESVLVNEPNGITE